MLSKCSSVPLYSIVKSSEMEPPTRGTSVITLLLQRYVWEHRGNLCFLGCPENDFEHEQLMGFYDSDIPGLEDMYAQNVRTLFGPGGDDFRMRTHGDLISTCGGTGHLGPGVLHQFFEFSWKDLYCKR